jgi:hypothetical protein
MVDRPIQKAIEEGIDTATEQTKTLCPWLPDPHKCDCGAYCDATRDYVAEQAAVMDVWQCPNDDCGQRYHRERD